MLTSWGTRATAWATSHSRLFALGGSSWPRLARSGCPGRPRALWLRISIDPGSISARLDPPRASRWWIFEAPRAPKEDVFRRFYRLPRRCRQKTPMLENLEKTMKNTGFCDVLKDGPQEEVEESCYDLLLLTYLGAVLTSLGLS